MSESKQPPAIKAKDLGHFRVLREFREALCRATEGEELHPSFSDPKRILQLGDYLGLMLFGLLNPVARTLRGLSAASKITKVQRDVCGAPASLGSLSEAQHLVDTDILERVFRDLAGKRLGQTAGNTDKKAAGINGWLAHDSSLWAALPRMAWALYGGGRESGDGAASRAVSLNLSFHVQADTPASFSVTEGRKCERSALREILRPGAAYVADRYYGIDYQFFGELKQLGCHFCIRLRDTAEMEVIGELDISRAEARAGVVRQAWVKLGKGNKSAQSCPLRVVHVRGCTGEILVIATDLLPGELPGDELALLYKNRWKIEYFFRWVKCLLKCNHWMAESRNGVSSQIYLALIAAVLVELQLGRRPSKRVWELLQWHQCGMLGDGELEGLLASQLATEREQRNRKRRRATGKKS